MPDRPHPLLFQYARRQVDFLEALDIIRSGVNATSIRNVHYQRAKEVIGRAFEEAWRKHVYEPHVLESLRHSPEEDPVRHEIGWASIMSLHDAIAAHKRVSKLDPNHPAAAAAAELLNEAQPLAMVMKDLKAHIVKGRVAPEAPPKEENPNKVIGACPCCFRGIAVLQTTGKMAHHGYKRPLPGFQSASCPGIRFKPLEESTEGLEWLIRLSDKNLAKAQDALESAPAVKQVTQASRIPRAEPEVITPDSPKWERAHKAYVAQCERSVRQAEAAIRMLDQELEKWRRFHEEKEETPRRSTRSRER